MIVVIGFVAVSLIFIFVCAVFRAGRLYDTQYRQMKRDLDLRHIERKNPK